MAREDVDVGARKRFADALARGIPVGAAARAAGYSRQQGWNLRNDPAFLVFVDRRRAELGQQAAAQSPATGAAQAAAPGAGGVGSRADAAWARRRLREIAASEPPEKGTYGPQVAACKELIALARKPVVKAAPLPEAPPALKMIPPGEDADAAKKWLEGQA